MSKPTGGILRLEDKRQMEQKFGLMIADSTQQAITKGTSNRNISISISDIVANGELNIGVWSSPKKAKISSISVCYLTVPSSPGNLNLDIRNVRNGVYHHSVINASLDIESMSNGQTKNLPLASGVVLKDDYLYLNIQSDNSTVTQGSAGIVTLTYTVC